MALKKREKIMMGSLTFAAAGFVILMGVMPLVDNLGKNLKTMGTLEGEITSLDMRIKDNETVVEKLKGDIALPEGVKIPQFDASNKEEIVKDILDKVVHLATEPGNKLIYLQPYIAPVIVEPLSPEDQAKVDSGEMAPPPKLLETSGYELAVRGTYTTIESFLTSLDQQDELIEVSSISLVNEAGADRSGSNTSFGGQDVILDPSRPIRLTAKLRLILKRS